MSIQSNASQLVHYVGDTINLDLSSVDFVDNYMCLGINQKQTLHFILHEDRKECVLSIDFERSAACVSNTSGSERALVLSFLLGANVLLVGANGASLAYDEDTDTVSIVTSFDIPDDVTQSTKEAFYAKVERLLDSYATWSDTFQSFALEETPQESVDHLNFSLRV